MSANERAQAAPELGDRVILTGDGVSAVVEDVSYDGPFPRAQIRYIATSRTEWVALDAIRKA